MKSKKYQLMLLAGALTVSFVANGAKVKDNLVKEGNNNIEEVEKNTDANVYGHVIDSKTGEHLPYVVIQVKGTTIGTTTDKTGHFFLKTCQKESSLLRQNMLDMQHKARVLPLGMIQVRS